MYGGLTRQDKIRFALSSFVYRVSCCVYRGCRQMTFLVLFVFIVVTLGLRVVDDDGQVTTKLLLC